MCKVGIFLRKKWIWVDFISRLLLGIQLMRIEDKDRSDEMKWNIWGVNNFRNYKLKSSDILIAVQQDISWKILEVNFSHFQKCPDDDTSRIQIFS